MTLKLNILVLYKNTYLTYMHFICVYSFEYFDEFLQILLCDKGFYMILNSSKEL